jgi:DNA-binding MarR family transcriptional regulator
MQMLGSTVDRFFKGLFYEILEIEQKALTQGDFRDLSVSEFHAIESIGEDGQKTMSQVAALLKVTLGTFTIIAGRLVRKGYVLKERSDNDRRIVYVRLTEAGQRAFRRHEAFHREMTGKVLAGLEPDEKKLLAGTLQRLIDFFDFNRRALQ